MNDTRPACSTASVSTPASFIAVDVVPRDAVEPFHHQHAPRDERRVRAGHDRGPLVGLGEHARDVEHVLRFEAEVELLDDRLREQLDERGRVRERGDRDPADEPRREPRHRRMSSRTRRATCGRCTFTTTSSPVRSRAACTCAIDAAAIGVAVEALEHVVERAAEVELHDPAHDVERLGRHPVAEQLELRRPAPSGKRPSPPEMIWPSLM